MSDAGSPGSFCRPGSSELGLVIQEARTPKPLSQWANGAASEAQTTSL